jgi:hypothetical protein
LSTDDYDNVVRPAVTSLAEAGCEDMGNPPGTPVTAPQEEALISLALSAGHYGLQFSSQEAHPGHYRGPRALFAAVKTDELHEEFYSVNIDGGVHALDR